MAEFKCTHVNAAGAEQPSHFHPEPQCLIDRQHDDCPQGLIMTSCNPYVPPPDEVGPSTARKMAIFTLILAGGVGLALWLRSDERLKRDIQLIARRPDGIGLYRFRYVGSAAVHEGVIAQEVARIRPDAVAIGSDGWLAVNYSMLDLAVPDNLPEVIYA